MIHSVIIFWISSRICNEVNLGKFSIRIPLVVHRSDPILKKKIVSKKHSILLSHASTGSVLIPPRPSTESEKAWVSAVANWTALSVSRVVSLHIGCRQSLVVIPIISVWSVISFRVTWNNCLNGFLGSFSVDLNFSVFWKPGWTAA